MDRHDNDPRFVEYYARQSESDAARTRAVGIMHAVARAREGHDLNTEQLKVADIGCNAGTQSFCWASEGHRVEGLDISADLVALATSRNQTLGLPAHFQVGSADNLPWQDQSFDVCLLPELLEHVENWEGCIIEAARVLRPGGSLYLSTTNYLCPKQQEFSLPLYSWYPAPLKDKCVELARTTRPEIANFATYPAVHWFSPYGLGNTLRQLGFVVLDRFDLIDTQGRRQGVRLVVDVLRRFPPARLLGHLATPSTVLVAHKQH